MVAIGTSRRVGRSTFLLHCTVTGPPTGSPCIVMLSFVGSVSGPQRSTCTPSCWASVLTRRRAVPPGATLGACRPASTPRRRTTAEAPTVTSSARARTRSTYVRGRSVSSGDQRSEWPPAPSVTSRVSSVAAPTDAGSSEAMPCPVTSVSSVTAAGRPRRKCSTATSRPAPVPSVARSGPSPKNGVLVDTVRSASSGPRCAPLARGASKAARPPIVRRSSRPRDPTHGRKPRPVYGAGRLCSPTPGSASRQGTQASMVRLSMSLG